VTNHWPSQVSASWTYR